MSRLLKHLLYRFLLVAAVLCLVSVSTGLSSLSKRDIIRPAPSNGVSDEIIIPPLQETPSYSGAGRMTGDAFWTYSWDEPGRLTGMTRKAAALPAANVTAETLSFYYDADGRRVRKVHTLTYSDNRTDVTESKVLWAGWLPVFETSFHDGKFILQRWFQWGPDLSGTLDGEGGIGGLLAIIEEKANGAKRTLLPVQDGLGNVTAVLDALTGQMVARYDYGPFGEPLQVLGDGDACPLRYQTKWFDKETDLSYFGYRYYIPRLGRWISRDPLGEDGGFNLYAYCGNDPVNRHDAVGLATGEEIIGGNLVKGLSIPFQPGFGSAPGFSQHGDVLTDEDLFSFLSEQSNDVVGAYLTADFGDPLDFYTSLAGFYTSGILPSLASAPSASVVGKPAGSVWMAGLGGALNMLRPLHDIVDPNPNTQIDGGFGVAGYVIPTPPGFDPSGEEGNLVSNIRAAAATPQGKSFLFGSLLSMIATRRMPSAALEEATVTLRFAEGMSTREFARKAADLERLGMEGRLFRAASPVARDRASTARFRQNLIDRIWRQYSERNPRFASQLIDRVTNRMSPDHIWELQLGGLDAASNLRMMDRFTNWHIGTQQIWPQIKGLPIGTPIRIRLE